MGSFEFHARKNIKVNMNSGLDSLGKLVNNTNSQKREGGYPFPSSISRDWNSCSIFQRSSMMLLPVWLEGALVTGAPLAFPHQWHFASLKGPQPPWSQTMPGCSAWQSFAKAFTQAYTLPLRHTSKLLNVLQDITWRPLLWVLPNSLDTICWPSPSPSIALDRISVLVLFVRVFPK